MSTLRDGAQTNGVDFTLADKQSIAKLLDGIGRTDHANEYRVYTPFAGAMHGMSGAAGNVREVPLRLRSRWYARPGGIGSRSCSPTRSARRKGR